MKNILLLLLSVFAFGQSYETHSYGEHPQQEYDVYFPETYNEQTPVVLFIHGGGWQAEHRQRDYYRSFVQRLFNAGENIVINMDYRLVTPGGDVFVFPNQIEDITSVISHMESEYNINNPITLTGNSAGGHLALWYYLNQVTPIDKIIPICAPYDGTIEVRPGVQYFQAALHQWIRNQFIDIEQYDFQTEQEAIDFASPHTFANRELNDIFYVHMTGDPLHQLEAIQRDYPNVEFEIYDTWHSGWLNNPHRDDLIQKMVDYISEEECLPPTSVNITRLSHTRASIDTNRNFTYQASANRTGRPLRPYPMYGMDYMVMPFTHTSLVPAFEYDVWLRAICEDETYSEWSEPFYVPLYEEPTENVRYYNIYGQEVNTPGQGYYIITDGKTSHKILKK